MKKQSKTVLAAAFVVATASAAMAATDGPLTIEDWNYLRNPSAPVPEYTVPYASPAYAQFDAFQGRAAQERSVQPHAFAPDRAVRHSRDVR